MTQRAADGSKRPTRIAGGLVHLATRVLPHGAVRDRYQREFMAELHGLSSNAQLRHATGILCTVGVLRHVLRKSAAASLDGAMLIANSKPLLCRMNLHHHWVPGWTDDGGRFQRCDRCDTDRYNSNHVNWPALGGYHQ